MERARGAVKRLALESLGWTLVVVGIAALVLPGPGLLLLFAGMAVLSQQYEWAERRLEPIKRQALKAAADGVRTVPRIAASALGALTVAGVGVLWGVSPPVPSWWPLEDRLWLPGGWGFGASLIVSSIIALALLAYAVKRFYGVDEADADREIDAGTPHAEQRRV